MRKGGSLARWRRYWRTLGPGIITGAADDDPSGIVTYAIAGAKGGFSLLWTAVITFPLMAAVQEMCARIGLVTSSGLAGVMKKRYSRPLLWSLALLVVVANTMNIGADLGAMAEATALLVPLPQAFLGFLYTALLLGALVYLPYRRIAGWLKWLTLALFAYVLAAFASRPDWGQVLRETVFPQVAWNRETIEIIVAIFGTTISPYLFFWQTSEEVEERREKSPFRVEKRIVTKNELKTMRDDVGLGMLFSNAVMFFIIVNAGAVLRHGGVGDVQTAGQVALALRPLAGDAAFLLYAVGIVGTGLLAIPVLAGGAAYVVAEVFGFREGLDRKFHEAKAFYGVILLSTAAGYAMNFFGIRPVDALFATAIVFGVLSPPLIFIIMDIANRKDIMGNKRNTWFQNALGVTAFLVMTAAVLSYLVFAVG